MNIRPNQRSDETAGRLGAENSTVFALAQRAPLTKLERMSEVVQPAARLDAKIDARACRCSRREA
jgi:hypothetical protein